MTWTPISENELLQEIDKSIKAMSVEQKNLWNFIKIIPEKWKQVPYGDQGDGFWVVGIIGLTVIWYNDIEGGFNRSPYKTYGTIERYLCNQDNLEWTIQRILESIEKGHDIGPFLGPPESLSK